MKASTKEALRSLKGLVKTAKETLYERVRLCATVMKDMDWIAEVYGGSDIKAQDALESEFFPDVHGWITLGKMLAMYREVPKKRWEELRYDLAAIEVLYGDMAKEEKEIQPRQRPSWKAIAEGLKEENEALRQDNARLKRRIAELEKENAKLGKAVDQLRGENYRLIGKMEQLEAMYSQVSAAGV